MCGLGWTYVGVMLGLGGEGKGGSAATEARQPQFSLGELCLQMSGDGLEGQLDGLEEFGDGLGEFRGAEGEGQHGIQRLSGL